MECWIGIKSVTQTMVSSSSGGTVWTSVRRSNWNVGLELKVLTFLRPAEQFGPQCAGPTTFPLNIALHSTIREQQVHTSNITFTDKYNPVRVKHQHVNYLNCYICMYVLYVYLNMHWQCNIHMGPMPQIAINIIIIYYDDYRLFAWAILILPRDMVIIYQKQVFRECQILQSPRHYVYK